jgi:YbbR domain-containing protein
MIQFLRELIFKDAMLKLFSLALAVLTWVALSSIQRGSTPASNVSLYSGQVTFYNVEVVILSSASDVHDYRVEPKTVEVTIEGDSKVLQTLESKNVRAMVDLTGLASGAEVTRHIEVSTPAGVRKVKVTPNDVRVLFPSGH